MEEKTLENIKKKPTILEYLKEKKINFYGKRYEIRSIYSTEQSDRIDITSLENSFDHKSIRLDNPKDKNYDLIRDILYNLIEKNTLEDKAGREYSLEDIYYNPKKHLFCFRLLDEKERIFEISFRDGLTSLLVNDSVIVGRHGFKFEIPK